MQPVAWLVVGERHIRAVSLDHESAMTQAVKSHGIIRDLVLRDDVRQLVEAAFEQGRAQGRMEKEMM